MNAGIKMWFKEPFGGAMPARTRIVLYATGLPQLGMESIQFRDFKLVLLGTRIDFEPRQGKQRLAKKACWGPV